MYECCLFEYYIKIYDAWQLFHSGAFWCYADRIN